MKISVVIPMHNAGKWLRETLDTIAAQTHPKRDIELVLVDDESTDDTAQIANDFLREGTIEGRVIGNKSNGGCGGPRNAGWPLASGDWIQFVDADDLLAPRKFEWQAACAASAPDDVAVIYSSWRHYEEVDGRWQPTGSTVECFVDDDTLVRILEDWQFGFVGPMLYRRSFLPKIGGFNGALLLGEDLDFSLRAAMAGARFRKAPTPEPAFLYRSTPGSMWRRATRRVGPMRDLADFVRAAELHLRERGNMSLAARLALGRRYAKYLDFFMENDPERYRLTLDWIRALDLPSPPGMGRGFSLISKILGYEKALELRLSVRKARDKVLAARMGGSSSTT
jgi:glycosyltransferase involved in cell wall biosynthesis